MNFDSLLEKIIAFQVDIINAYEYFDSIGAIGRAINNKFPKMEIVREETILKGIDNTGLIQEFKVDATQIWLRFSPELQLTNLVEEINNFNTTLLEVFNPSHIARVGIIIEGVYEIPDKKSIKSFSELDKGFFLSKEMFIFVKDKVRSQISMEYVHKVSDPSISAVKISADTFSSIKTEYIKLKECVSDIINVKKDQIEGGLKNLIERRMA